MLRIPGQAGKDNCDKGVGPSRRDILRVGGSAMMGMSLGQMMELQSAKANNETTGGGPGWNKAKSVILVYLQGGGSHLDLWDPERYSPDNVRSVFKHSCKVPGMDVCSQAGTSWKFQCFHS